eukprot:CAMPEP_0172543512 /NCGR_PEP_ID=MMETSP1067-20121228/13885_1 /TAXON_ID=265564 ORGANISM="Thalassiosira punctigera, Strain Tpunct2005C2" /NCGR_SAMPLE_ID=MMETSP1067 /ASSEMBLY_ACC=CAM_ASM_000444 /LENGTH=109 /DNA_ID=CAMNT_0013329943 /DNA_START=89 /DNA_END=414 /DNA_ORIENTATION=+
MADAPPVVAVEDGAPSPAAAAAPFVAGRRSKRRRKACPSSFSTNPYQKQYEWITCRRRAVNSPPKSPLKSLTPASLRKRCRLDCHAASAVANLRFADDIVNVGGNDEEA